MWKSKTNRKTSIERGGSWDPEMALWGQNGGKGKMAEGEMRCTSCTFLFFFSSPVFCSSCFVLPWNCCFPVRLVFLLPLFYFCMFCMCTSVFCQWDIFTNHLCHFFAPRGPEIHVASGKTTSTITTTIIAPSPMWTWNRRRKRFRGGFVWGKHLKESIDSSFFLCLFWGNKSFWN